MRITRENGSGMFEAMVHCGPSIETAITASWECIVPLWPLQHVIAVNPLAGLEHHPIETALAEADYLFTTVDNSDSLQAFNRHSLKWLPAFYDKGQATIPMPLRQLGLFNAWRQLAIHDYQLHGNAPAKQEWLKRLPSSAIECLSHCFKQLGIAQQDHTQYLTLLLTSLYGWASYVKYMATQTGADEAASKQILSEYLAFRLASACLLWPEITELHHNDWGNAPPATTPLNARWSRLTHEENAYHNDILKRLQGIHDCDASKHQSTPAAQLLFCIDTRSGPLRQAIEVLGRYQTFGVAGFFGLPISVMDDITEQVHASCPVLLRPQAQIKISMPTSGTVDRLAVWRQWAMDRLKRCYHGLKYNLAAPFLLTETMGPLSGMRMVLNTFLPNLSQCIRSLLGQSSIQPKRVVDSLNEIPEQQQADYAAALLKSIGLTHSFAPIVVLCAHGSITRNNPHATALDCGACGGHHGTVNAQAMAMILNQISVRGLLKQQGITIPESTQFIAATHQTTTDEITFHSTIGTQQQQLQHDLAIATSINRQWRAQTLRMNPSRKRDPLSWLQERSNHWAEVRPEWGLAKNALFVVGPNTLIHQLMPDGRTFFHSYDWQQDSNGEQLTGIMTAPMVVAQWINAQYLFSTLDNPRFGSGSKITQNITAKIGVMQGNASDLMTFLPLQSVQAESSQDYHQPMRLLTIVYSTRQMVSQIIDNQPQLQRLFGNGWVLLACLEPETGRIYRLKRDFSWQPFEHG